MLYPDGYPAPPGNKQWSIAEIYGPAAYVEVVPAAPVITGGQVVQATEWGLKLLEALLGGMASDNGQYIVYAIPNGVFLGKPMTSVRLMWVVADGGVEVAADVDLSARYVRIPAMGVY